MNRRNFLSAIGAAPFSLLPTSETHAPSAEVEVDYDTNATKVAIAGRIYEVDELTVTLNANVPNPTHNPKETR